MKYNARDKKVIVEPADWERLNYQGRPILSILREVVQQEAAKKNLNLNIGNVIAINGNVEISFYANLEEVLNGLLNAQRSS